jgi:hypothetical protein
MQTEFPFTLPRGYLAPDGTVHRSGIMRLAAAADEIVPLEDPRVRANRAYLVILLLARVIVRLGDFAGDDVSPALVERLFSADLAYLEDFYREINGLEISAEEVTCPRCGERFEAGGASVRSEASKSSAPADESGGRMGPEAR